METYIAVRAGSYLIFHCFMFSDFIPKLHGNVYMAGPT